MHIVFDFGVVLFTWRPADMLAATFPDRAGDAHAAGQLAHAVFGHADWHAFDRGTLAMEEVIERTAQRLDLPRPALADLLQGMGEQLQPVAGSVAVLRALHARKMAGEGVQGLYFLSNMPVPYARHLEAHHDFLALFDGGIFSGDVHLIKPEAAIYQALQDRYALAAPQICFIDDLKHNVEAARKQGWQGLHFTTSQALATHFGI